MNEFRFHPNLLMRLQTFQNMPLKNENIAYPVATHKP
jgi:hypothetical protein